MKTLISSFIVLFMVGILGFSPQQLRAQEAQVSFQVFYDGLSPYGTWVDYPGRGYVWIPVAGVVPYSTAGHWVYTDDGWMWVSDYSWGWAPFHYGLWDYDPDYGWYWVPGEEWAPAWVSWDYCDGYYGWAPMGFGVVAANQWCFVNERHFDDPHVSRYYAPRSQNTTFINKSTSINRSGPSKDAAEKSTGHKITPVSVTSNSRPGQSVGKNSISIYKPSVSKTTKSQPKPAPAKVAKLKDMSHRGSVKSVPKTNKTVSKTQKVAQKPNVKNEQKGITKQNKKVVHPKNVQHKTATPISSHKTVKRQSNTSLNSSSQKRQPSTQTRKQPTPSQKVKVQEAAPKQQQQPAQPVEKTVPQHSVPIREPQRPPQQAPAMHQPRPAPPPHGGGSEKRL